MFIVVFLKVIGHTVGVNSERITNKKIYEGHESPHLTHITFKLHSGL